MFALPLTLFEFGRGWIEMLVVGVKMPVSDPESANTFLIVAGYVLSYCFTTAALRSSVLWRAATVLPLATAILGVGLIMGPYMLEFFTSDPRRFSMLPWYLLGSPVVLSTSNHQAIATRPPTVVVVWVILSGIAATTLVYHPVAEIGPAPGGGAAGNRESRNRKQPCAAHSDLKPIACNLLPITYRL